MTYWGLVPGKCEPLFSTAINIANLVAGLMRFILSTFAPQVVMVFCKCFVFLFFKVSCVHLPYWRQKPLSLSWHSCLLSLTIFPLPVLDVPQALGIEGCIVDISLGLGEHTICSWYFDQLWISVVAPAAKWSFFGDMLELHFLVCKANA